jgi:hypothetical protein
MRGTYYVPILPPRSYPHPQLAVQVVAENGSGSHLKLIASLEARCAALHAAEMGS